MAEWWGCWRGVVRGSVRWCRCCCSGGGGGGGSGSSGGVTAERQRVVALNAASTTPQYGDNRVSNTKYTAATFLPKNLAEQFSAPMNLYFLLIAFLQLWPAITPVNPITTWAPLALVTAITAVREAVDDARRARGDAAANGARFLVARDGGAAAPTAAADIRPGDLVAVPDGVEVPCDLLLLRVGAAANAGVAYVETANLDGETDLKTRQARHETQALAPEALRALRGRVTCEPPNGDLYRLDAALELHDGGTLPLTGLQLVQHGVVVRKCGGLWGAALYTGGDTKLSQNKAPPPTKTARIDALINRFVVVIFVAQLALVAAFGVAGALRAGTGEPSLWYLGWQPAAAVAHGDHMDVMSGGADVDNEEWAAVAGGGGGGGGSGGGGNHTLPAFRLRGGRGGAVLPPGVVTTPAGAPSALPSLQLGQPWYAPLVLPLRFLLLSSMMVPISLKVSLDLIKLVYARAIATDTRMYDAPSGTYARAATTDIVEDLGSVEYVLADKTGTLTDNMMSLQSAVVGAARYAAPDGVDATTVTTAGAGAGAAARRPAAAPPTTGTSPAPRPAAADDAHAHPSLYAAAGGMRTALAAGEWRAAEFCRVLALCNSVTPEHVDARAVSDHSSAGGAALPAAVAASRARCVQYASSSPDEEALVHGAARLGVALAFRRRDDDGTHKVTLSVNTALVGGAAAGRSHEPSLPHLTAADVAAKRVWIADVHPHATYVVLHVLEFTSDRKCMSVIVRRVDGGRARGGSGGSDGGSAAAAAAAVASGGGFGSGYGGVDSDDLVLLTKGADEVVRPRLAPLRADEPAAAATRAAVEEHLQACADAGLRTLMVGGRSLTHAEYAAWLPTWERAQHQLLDRAGAVAAAAAVLERGLVLLGATAIEDKLQGGVPATIAALRDAGIRVWMLTGDKAETALQVATAAHVVDAAVAARFRDAAAGVASGGGNDAPALLLVRGATEDAVEAELRAAARRLTPRTPRATAAAATAAAAAAASGGSGSSPEGGGGSGGGRRSHDDENAALLPPPATAGVTHRWRGGTAGGEAAASRQPAPTPTPSPALTPPPSKFVLVLDGIAAIRHALAPQHAALLSRVALSCDAVLACRCLPSQKAALAALVRAAGHMAVAIGDGGNDVAMIQAAHVGVGVSGREGQQAARAADFSIAQFRFLLPLLLVHGRHAAYRTALVSQYTFYKSMCICFVQMGFNAACAFSGCSLLDTFALTTYNLIYTFAPGVAMVLDHDRAAGHLLRVPALYRESQAAAWFTPATFAAWCGRALLQAAALLVIALAGVAAGGGGVHGDADQTVVAYVVYTTLVAVQLITVATEMRAATAANHAINAACAGVYVAFVALRDVFPADSSSLGTMAAITRTGAPLAAIALGVVVAVAPVVALRAWRGAAAAPQPRRAGDDGSGVRGHGGSVFVERYGDAIDVSATLKRCGHAARTCACLPLGCVTAAPSQTPAAAAPPLPAGVSGGAAAGVDARGRSRSSSTASGSDGGSDAPPAAFKAPPAASGVLFRGSSAPSS